MKKNRKESFTFLNLNHKINAILLVFATKISFVNWKIYKKVQKIDEFVLKIFKIIIASFLLSDKLEKVCLVLEILLLANIKLKIH